MTDAVTEFRTVHAWHHLVGNHDVWDSCLYQLHSILSALCRKTLVGRFQSGCQKIENLTVVINNQDSLLFRNIFFFVRFNGWGSTKWQRKSYFQTTFVLCLYLASMHLNILLDNRQTYPGTVMSILPHIVTIEES